ncbi:MAG: NADPH:quinone oxidoreductase family protein, partial [Pseudomonadota bacterium]
GGDIAGVIKAVGKNVTDYKQGDSVFGRGEEGCAEEVIADPKLLRRLPAGVDFTVAVSLGNYGTSSYALRDRGLLKAGETLLVLGASGGVGLAAVELGKMMGARVIACASSQEKLDTCKRMGADELINYETQSLRDCIKELTEDKGVDVVYDPVGDKYADPAVRSLAWGGRYLVLGFAAGEIPKVALNLPLLKGSAIVGVWAGGLKRNNPRHAQAVSQEVLELVAAGRLKPYISATYPLERTADALKDLMNRKVQGKIVVVMGS